MSSRRSLLAQLLLGPPRPATRLSELLAGAPPSDPVDALRASLPPLPTPETRAGRPNRLAELTMPSPEFEPAVRPFGSPHVPAVTTPSEERRLLDLAMMLGNFAGPIKATIYRGAAPGAHSAPGGFWSRSPEMAQGHAARTGGTVAQAGGVSGPTFGPGHPLTLGQIAKMADAIKRTHGAEWADDFARALPLEVPPANAADLRRLAAQAGGADMSDAAPLVQFWLRRSFGLGGANEPLRRAGFTAIDYGRDVQVLDPRALVRQ